MPHVHGDVHVLSTIFRLELNNVSGCAVDVKHCKFKKKKLYRHESTYKTYLNCFC